MKKLLLSSSALTIIVMGINFLFKIYLSYKILKEQIGLFYTFMDVIAIGVMPFSGFKDALVVAYDKSDYSKILFWYKSVFVIIALVILMVEIGYYTVSQFSYPLPFLILLFVLNSYMIYLSYLNASQKKYTVMLFENLVMAVGLVGGFLISSLYIDEIYALFFGYMLAYISRIFYLKLISNMELSDKKSSFSIAKDFFKNTAYSSLMYFFSGLFINISGIVFLYFYHDKAVLGEYQVVVRSIFFALVAIFVFPLNTFTFPQISKLIADKKFSEIVRIEKKLINYLILFFLLLLLSTLFTKYIISFVFPVAYAQSYIMLNWMLPFLPFIAYTTFALNIIKGANRFDLALIVRVAGSVLFFVVFYLFYKIGTDASKTLVLSLDSAFFVMFLCSLLFRRKVLQ